VALRMKKSSDLLVSEFVDSIVLVYRVDPSEHEDSAALCMIATPTRSA
jgi:hypothetical protein